MHGATVKIVCDIIWDPLHSDGGKSLWWGYFYDVCGALAMYSVEM